MTFAAGGGRRLRQLQTAWYELASVRLALRVAFAAQIGGGATANDVHILCFDLVSVCGGGGAAGTVVALLTAQWQLSLIHISEPTRPY